MDFATIRTYFFYFVFFILFVALVIVLPGLYYVQIQFYKGRAENIPSQSNTYYSYQNYLGT